MDLEKTRIFEFEIAGEREWMAAKTIIQAVKFYHTMVDVSELDDDDEVTELPREKWSEMKVKNCDYDTAHPDADDWQEKTFEDFVKDEIVSLPCMIAETNYD